MKKLLMLLIVMLNLFPPPCSGQQNKIDSLQTLLKNDKEDTIMVTHLNELSWELKNSNLDTAFILSNKALVILNEIKNISEKEKQRFRANTLGQLGSCYYLKGDYPNALDYFLNALKLDEELNNNKRIVSRHTNIGIVYSRQGNYPKALDYFFKALKVAEELGDKMNVARILGNIGSVYSDEDDYPKALDYYSRALKLSEELGAKNLIADRLGNIGALYYEQGDYPQSLDYHFRALKMKEELGNKMGIAGTLGNIGNVYADQGDYPKALDYYLEVLKIAEELGANNLIATVRGNIGLFYYRTGKFKEAEEYLKKAIALSDSIGGMKELIDQQGNLSLLYETTDRHQLALIHYKKAMVVKDTLFNQEKDKQITQKEMNYEFEKKEAAAKAEQDKKDAVALQHMQLLNKDKELKEAKLNEQQTQLVQQKLLAEKKENDIVLLNQVQEIQKLELSKKEGDLRVQQYQTEAKTKEVVLLSKDKEVQQKEIGKQKIIRNGFVGGLAVVLLFSIVVFGQKKKITKEKQRSDDLLLNILPSEVAEELKLKGESEAKQFEDVTVLFTDFVNFTGVSEKLSPKELVGEIHHCFTAFDEIIGRNGLEKIKTTGDAYMAVGGLPNTDTQHATKTVAAAQEILKFMNNRRKALGLKDGLGEVRIGINSGSVVAGIVGVKKFAYDIWGDTVNIAARMESSGEAGKVNISGTTYELVKEKFKCIHRGKIQAKNKGEIDMYFAETIS